MTHIENVKSNIHIWFLGYEIRQKLHQFSYYMNRLSMWIINFVLKVTKVPLVKAGQGTQQESGYIHLKWETLSGLKHMNTITQNRKPQM